MKLLFSVLALFFFIHGHAQTQYELNEKEARLYNLKDAELNKVYKKLVAMTDVQKHKAMLVKAQRAWILYRNAHCAFAESTYDGGSMQPMVYSACMREVTEQRIAELKSLIEERSPK